MPVSAGKENTRRFLGLPTGMAGFGLYTLALVMALLSLPDIVFDPSSQHFLIIIGTLSLWRYGWGLTHYIRYLVYTHHTFPKLRREADLFSNLPPPHIYLLITSFRIEASTSMEAYRSSIAEAIACKIPATIIASLVELSDEFLIKQIFTEMNPPSRVKLHIVRVAGTGKRDGLAQGFRTISRLMPDKNALVAVIDGDSILQAATIRQSIPFFMSIPDLGALTTDEECRVVGSRLMKEWHDLRFSQRQILMGSVSLSGKVLTLTGRMSMFRADIVTHPDFIRQIEHDSIDHWRLGNFKFLTGDDKSSWYWVLKNEYRMLYVSDVKILTIEHPPSAYFLKASSMLMVRWFGNMLRTNGRVLKLGPARVGLFTWWCLLDQRVSMWTCLCGPAIAIMISLKHSAAFIGIYFVWVGLTRWVMTLMLLSSRPHISWYYPFLIYYNQVWGSLIKTYIFFHLDKQSWTRQKTRLGNNKGIWPDRFLRFSSTLTHITALALFLCVIGIVSGTMPLHFH